MATTHILLIINPVSGKMKSKTGLFEILDELYRSDPFLTVSEEGTTVKTGDPVSSRRVTVCPTMYRGHAGELAAHSAEEGFDTVICCGGDGTLNETIGGLLTIPEEQRPYLGYIPAGSTNDFAASIGLPTSLREAARITVGEEGMPIDMGFFCPEGTEEKKPGKDSLSRYFSYIASFGAFTAASYSTPQSSKNVIGHAAYVLEGIKDLGSIQPYHARVELSDGTSIEDDFVFGAVTNTTSAGGVVRLPPEKVSMSDGLLEVFLIHHPRNVTDLNRILSSLVGGTFDRNPMIEFHHATQADFTMTSPLCWSLDGERAEGRSKVHISCIPHAVCLKLPSPDHASSDESRSGIS